MGLFDVGREFCLQMTDCMMSMALHLPDLRPGLHWDDPGPKPASNPDQGVPCCELLLRIRPGMQIGKQGPLRF